MSKTVTKAISELLKPLPIQHKLSAADLNDGNIPVYSAETQNSGVKGFYTQAEFKIDKNDFKRQKYIVFGDHTRSVNIVTRDFCVMDNVKVLVPIHENLSLEYIKSQWCNNIPNLGYARHWKIAKDVKIKIPINNDGLFDLEKQREIAKKYLDVEQKRSVLLEKIEELKKLKIVFDSDKKINYEEVPIVKLFTPKGGDMKLSKSYCKEHIGAYPVYSGSTSREVFGNIDNYKYDGDYLTWVIDGLAGYVMKLSGQFSITCHRGILIPTKECKDIDLLYVKYMIEPIFRKRVRGRIGINGKNEYTALKPSHIVNYNDSILIPVDKNGNYDLKKQQDLAMKYATIETIKENIYNEIYNLTNIVVN